MKYAECIMVAYNARGDQRALRFAARLRRMSAAAVTFAARSTPRLRKYIRAVYDSGEPQHIERAYFA